MIDQVKIDMTSTCLSPFMYYILVACKLYTLQYCLCKQSKLYVAMATVLQLLHMLQTVYHNFIELVHKAL